MNVNLQFAQSQNKRVLIIRRLSEIERLRNRVRNAQHRLTVAFDEEVQIGLLDAWRSPRNKSLHLKHENEQQLKQQ